MELFDRLRIGVLARTLHFLVNLGRMNLAHRLKAGGKLSKVTRGRMNLGRRLNVVGTFSKVTLGRMNLAHRLNAVGAFSKITGTLLDILEGYALKDTHVNELHRKNMHVIELQRKKDTRF